jgi:hypothetical protein
MIPLRVTAILASVFFIAYGAMGHFLPVLTLHAIQLPLNSLRLVARVGRSVTSRETAASMPQTEAAPAARRDDAFTLEPSTRRYIDA